MAARQQSFSDDKVGHVEIKRIASSRGIRLRITLDGHVRVSAPPRLPLFIIKQTVKASRRRIEEMLAQYRKAQHVYENGDQIGQSHTLQVVPALAGINTHLKLRGKILVLSISPQDELADEHVQALVRKQVANVLRREAALYLSARLKILAARHDLHYSSVRFTHAATRWGSCSSQGTISLNIALMKLPLPLSDYVIMHELAHTQHMDHSARFWDLVHQLDPLYKLHRRQLKSMSPQL